MNPVNLPTGNGRTANLILVALVRKLVDKGILSDDDVRDLLIDAAKGFDDVAGVSLTLQAARTVAEEDLIPAFLGAGPAAG